ncbi:zinc finger protein OZF-like isoform X1 [Arapaima gigas]
MNVFVKAAVEEMGKLVEEGSSFVLRLELLRGEDENEALKKRLQTESALKTVQFASTLETLGNAAVDKIIRLVDDTKLQLVESSLLKAPGKSEENKPRKRERSLHIHTVRETATDGEHSSSLKEEISHMSPVKDKFTGINQHSVESLAIGEAEHGCSIVNDDPLEGIKTYMQTAKSYMNDEDKDMNRTGEEDLSVTLSKRDCPSRDEWKSRGSVQLQQL